MGDTEEHSLSSSTEGNKDEPAKKMKVDSSITSIGGNEDEEMPIAPLTVVTCDESVEKTKKEEKEHCDIDAGSEPQPLSISSTSSEPKEEAAVAGTSESNVADISEQEVKEDFGPEIELRVVVNKKPLTIKMPIRKTIGDMKELIEKQTKVSPPLQKVLYKGIPKDISTLESLGITNHTKILVIGTSLKEVMEATKPPDKETLALEDLSSRTADNNWCGVTQHKKILDKGVPSDAMPGILNEHDPLPEIPLFGMLNAKGGKVRLTFKLELDELWIGTKERTEKIPIGSIRNVESQPITGYEHYHILAIQLGPTEASRYFVYWVPAHYINAIKDSLGN